MNCGLLILPGHTPARPPDLYSSTIWATDWVMMTTTMMMANLSFVLLKINDTDIVKLQEEQRDTAAATAAALDLLLSTTDSENIVLQLKRKASCWLEVGDGADDVVDISKKICYLKLQQQTCPDIALSSPTAATAVTATSTASSPEIVVSLHLPNSLSTENVASAATSKSTQTDDMAYYVHEQLRNIQKDTERLIEEEHNLFEQSLAPEIDIEEITLRKTHSHERLGLTVCYSNGEEYGEGGVGADGSGGSGGSGNEVYGVGNVGVTEVYISDIHADSVAGRDGRLRQGDQILQINGKDITTREETETLIAENNNAVTLLISRYLYGEDDFNDPSTNEDDDEVLVVEDDELLDDDEEEFYDDNNMTYVNCMTSNECCLNNVEDFDKAIMSQVEQQQQQQQDQGNDSGLEVAAAANITSVMPTNTAVALSKDKMRYNNKNDKKFSNSMRNQTNSSTINPAVDVNTNKTSSSSTAMAKAPNHHDNKTSDYYESEHIYETIPEDPESEPFYCSPYDSSVYVTAIASCSSSTVTDAAAALQQQMQQHKQRVVQWLGINPSQGICQTALPTRHSLRSSSGCGRSLKNRHKTSASAGTMRSTMTSLTNGGSVDGIGSAMTLPASQVDDQDNSSSAYNTGGSNNSVSPHSLLLNPKAGRTATDVFHSNAGCLPMASTAASADDILAMQQQLMMQHKMSAVQQKILSPKDKNKITSPKSTNKLLPTMDLVTKPNIFSVNNSEAVNMQRNLMVQQHLLKQTLVQDKVGQMAPPPYYQHQPQTTTMATTTATDQLHCPQFTAPNLSQYHFVSSQEVNNLSLNNKIPKSSPTVAETAQNNCNAKKNDGGEEEAMVWKVKRRPDGTRYIVRRPAKSRQVIKERNVRLNVERLRDDITTTEDDTMSEIKTGRYWTREERKKHIEKAKERRQQQQLQYQQQLQQQLQHKANTTYDESCSTEQQQEGVAQQQKHSNFLSFSRQKYRQHYQLQFNSAQAEAAQKHKSTLNYHNVTSTGISSNVHEDIGTNTGTDQTDGLTVATTTSVTAAVVNSTHVPMSTERNNISGNTISVTTV